MRIGWDVSPEATFLRIGWDVSPESKTRGTIGAQGAPPPLKCRLACEDGCFFHPNNLGPRYKRNKVVNVCAEMCHSIQGRCANRKGIETVSQENLDGSGFFV